jgi:hypothetical protein
MNTISILAIAFMSVCARAISLLPLHPRLVIECQKRRQSFSFLLPIALITSVSTTADAAVYLSGDGNIVNHLVLSGGIDLGNQQFFKNILQGGTKVAVLRNTFVGCCETFDENISAYYNSLPGVTATTIIGTVDATGLSGANLFLSAIPDDAFTPPEISALHNFLIGGGSVFFLGENSSFPTQNAFINDALADLGIPMSITTDTNESGDVTVSGAEIAADPSTVGVTTFTYAAPSAVTGGKFLIFNVDHVPIIESNVPEPGTAILALFASVGIAAFARSQRS